MPPSYEDQLQRQIRALAAALARIMGLRSAGAIEEARLALDQAYQDLLGDQHDVLGSVDVATAAHILNVSSRVAAYSRLVREEAELAADPVDAAALRLRALQLGIEATLRGYEEVEFVRYVREIAREVDEQSLSGAHREKLSLLRST